MPKRAQNNLKNDLKVLEHLLIKSNEIIYRKKLSGYGCNLTSFDDPNKGLTKKIFRTRRDEFVNKKFMIQIKGNKNNSTYYSISPIGICYYVLYSDKIIKNEVNRAFMFFRNYYNQARSEEIDSYYKTFADDKGVNADDLKNSIKINTLRGAFENAYRSEDKIKQFIDKIDQDVSLSAIKKACRSVTIKQTKSTISISLIYPIDDDSEIVLKNFILNGKVILMKYNEYSLFSSHQTEKINEYILFQKISQHIVDMYHFFLIKFCFDEREELRRLKRDKHEIKNYQSRLDKIEKLEVIIPKKIFKRSFEFTVIPEKALDMNLRIINDLDNYLLVHLPEIRRKLNKK
jgi:hypothetical protein